MTSGRPAFGRPASMYTLGSLALLGIALLIGAFSLSPGQRAAAVDAGTALDFNSAAPSDYVTFGAAPGLGVSTFTIETWFKREGTGIATNTGSGGIADAIPLVTKGRAQDDGSNIDMNYFLGIQASTNRLMADFEEGPGGPGPIGQNHPVVGIATITSNVWHHAAVTYGNGTWRLYLDGALDRELIVTGNPTPRFDSIQHAGLATAMDTAGAPLGFFDGVLDEARIWNVARTQADIQATKDTQLPTAAGLIGRWGMNEGSGVFVGDSSGGSNNGTATNGPVWVNGFPLPGTPTPTPTPGPPGTATPTPTPTPGPAPALAGHWTMDAGSLTQIDDSSGLGNHGALFNQASRVMPGRIGSHALAVDGTSGTPSPVDYALVPDHPSLDITNAITLAAWIKPEQRATQDLVKKATFGSVNGYELTLAAPTSSAPNKVFVRFNQATSMDALRVNSTAEYPMDGLTWIHVAATYNGSMIRLYVNGVEEASLPASFTIVTNTVGLSIGAQNDADATRAYKGQLDDVRIYSAALSAAAISDLAGNPSPTPTSTATPTPVATATAAPTGTPAPTTTPTVVPIAPVASSADTGEKPQSKVWLHAGTWWAVFPSTSVAPAGTWLWRLQANNAWTNVLHLSNSTTARADTKAIGNVTHILLHGSAPELVSVEYVPAGNTYQLWSARGTSTPITLPDSETATIDVDSTGRMWLATESGANVNVYYSDSPYSLFTGPITLANNINADDISVVTALPNGTIGVLWSNQTTQRFGFRVHVDGTNPNTWLADEVPASQSALNVGLGMADDHLNVAVASDGTLYAAVKTSYDTAGFVKIALLIRRPAGGGGPGGTWDDLYEVDDAGTRGIVLLNETADTLRVIYTSSEGFNDIVSKETATSTISFGPRQTLMSPGLNNATSTKQNWTNEVVVLASSASSTHGVRIVIPGSTPTPTPTATPVPTPTPTPAPSSDSDGDGFSNTVEISAGTDPFLACGIDAWPADINNDSFSDITDLALLTGDFGEPVGSPPNPPARYDIAPDPPDGFVDITDISRMTGLFGETCTGITPTPTPEATPTSTPTPTPTPTATPTPTPTATPASAGTALDFDGSNDYVTFGPASGLGLATFTVETWFKREGAGVGTNTGSGGIPNAIPLLTKGRSETDGSTVDMNYFLGIRATDGVLVADFEEGPGGPGPLGQNHPVIGATAATSNVWHHAAATYDGTTWRLYLDGALDAELAPSGGPDPRSDSIQHAALASALNSTGVAAGFFNGVLDEARVWNVARDQAQIVATRNMEVPAASGLIGRWGMNEGSGSFVGDSSGGAHNGTATNGPLWVGGAPLSGGSPPATPLLNAPPNGATGVSTNPTLDVSVSDPDDDDLTVSFYGREATPPSAPDFTIVALPDTQHYADENLNYAYVAQFGEQTQWVVDTEATLNTEFVTHLGDVVEHIDQFDQEWVYASDAMEILDDAGIKNNLAPGNHDLTSQGVGNKFDQYFPPSRYSMHSWYGNYLGGNGEAINRLNKDNYELFEVGSLQFIIFHLEYDTPDYVINWTQDVLDQYPDRRAIITTHAFVNTSNARPTGVINRPDGRSPEYLWQNLVRSNCNIFLVLNGHFPGEGRRTDLNDCGQPVHQVLADYQSRINGGDGWLRSLTFKPAENKIYVSTFSPTRNGGLGEFETDADSQFVLDYNMASLNFQLIATNSGVLSGNNTTTPWAGLTPATQYEWYVVLSDGILTTTGPTWTFTTQTTLISGQSRNLMIRSISDPHRISGDVYRIRRWTQIE